MNDYDSRDLKKPFSCYEELKTAIQKYEADTGLKLRTAHSETMGAYIKRLKKTNKNSVKERVHSALRYQFIELECQFSPNCNFKLKYSVVNNKLTLTKLVQHTEHPQMVLGNITIPESMNSQIKFGIKSEAKTGLLAKSLNEDLNSTHTFDAKFINNRFAQKLKNEKQKDIKDEIKILKSRKELLELPLDSGKEITYCQSKNMSSLFNMFSEMVFIDSTHKLLKSNQTVMYWFCVNGEGRTEPLLYAILPDEKSATIDVLFTHIKSVNETSHIEVFMTDKDFVFRDQLVKNFPGRELMLCLFHVTRVLYGRLFDDIRKLNKEDQIYFLKTLKILYMQKQVMTTTIT